MDDSANKPAGNGPDVGSKPPETPVPIANPAPTTEPAPEPTGGKPEDAPPPTQGQVLQPSGGHKKHTGIRVILILVIALVLAGLAVYFYTKNGNSTTPPQTNNTTNTEPAEVNASEVDTTIDDVDNAIKTADSAGDIESSDLDNTNLGL